MAHPRRYPPELSRLVAPQLVLEGDGEELGQVAHGGPRVSRGPVRPAITPAHTREQHTVKRRTQRHTGDAASRAGRRTPGALRRAGSTERWHTHTFPGSAARAGSTPWSPAGGWWRTRGAHAPAGSANNSRQGGGPERTTELRTMAPTLVASHVKQDSQSKRTGIH